MKISLLLAPFVRLIFAVLIEGLTILHPALRWNRGIVNLVAFFMMNMESFRIMVQIPSQSSDIDHLGSPVQFTIVSSQLVSKHVYKSKDSVAASPLSNGQVLIRSYDSLEQVQDFLKNLYHTGQFEHKVMISGIHVSAEFELQTGDSIYARNQKTFNYPSGRGLLHIDYDPKDESLTRSELYQALYQAVPELEALNSIHKPSAGSCVYDGNIEIKGLGGQHIFFEVPEPKDIPRLSEILYKRLWLKGYGYIKISKSGTILERSIIDKAVFSPERIIYLGAVLEDGLTQQMDIRYKAGKGEYHKVYELTLEESIAYKNLVVKAREKAKEESNSIQSDYFEEMSKVTGIPKYELAKDIKRNVLPRQWPIYLDQFTKVTIEDLLKDPNKYDRKRCCDPLVPSTYDYEQVCMINLHGFLSNIYSHAHGGGIKYDLIEGLPSFAAYDDKTFAKVEDAIDYIAKAYVYSKESDIEKSELVKDVSITYNVGKRDLNKRLSELIKGYRKQLQQAQIDDQKQIEQPSSLSFNQEIPWESFPDRIEKENSEGLLVISSIKGTVNNLNHLSSMYGITYQYDELLKDQKIILPFHQKESDLRNEADFLMVRSQCTKNGLPLNTSEYVTILMNLNTINPIKSWILSKEWDGIDRKQDLMNTITLTNPEEIELSKQKMDLWLLQCIAAMDGGQYSPLTKSGVAKSTYEHILVLSGGQGIYKTKWLSSLVPIDLSEYIRTGIMLALQDKDSQKSAISSWICELGELESTFRKSDIAQIKAFISSLHDYIRLPYGKAENQFKRRTSFCATVNQSQFLQDLTGNRRFWIIEVDRLNFMHTIDLQQMWRQVWDEYIGGAQWWPEVSLTLKLEVDTVKHIDRAPIIDIFNVYYDVEAEPIRGECIRTNAPHLIRGCGENPSSYNRAQVMAYLKECGISHDKKKYYRIMPRPEFEVYIRGILAQPRRK